MKITKVDVWVLDAGEQRGARYPICCRVYTDEGIYGDGEAGVAYGTGYTAAYGMIIDMARHIIGMDPMNTELIWETILKGTFWGQGGGVVVFSGMSAIDIALMDIKGKALGVPIYQLLGGKCRDELLRLSASVRLDHQNRSLGRRAGICGHCPSRCQRGLRRGKNRLYHL